MARSLDVREVLSRIDAKPKAEIAVIAPARKAKPWAKLLKMEAQFTKIDRALKDIVMAEGAMKMDPYRLAELIEPVMIEKRKLRAEQNRLVAKMRSTREHE